jgi:hypothetical protein
MSLYTPIPAAETVELHGNVGIAAFLAAQDLQDRRALLEAKSHWPDDRDDDYYSAAGAAGKLTPDLESRIRHLSLVD